METFDFKKDYQLENEFVLLRPLTWNDLDHFRSFSENEPEIWKYTLVQAGGMENLRKYLTETLLGREQGKEYAFSVFDKRKQQYAGSTRFHDMKPAAKTLLLGYTWYGKAFQGTGINKNCKYLLLKFAFETLGMERVEFRADTSNIRSIRAMKGIGCIEEGVLRSTGDRPEGGRRDSIVLSIIRSDWESKIKTELKLKAEACF